MRRLHIMIEKKWWDRLKKDMKSHGFVSVSGFIRYIIIKFFEEKK
jgi:hypothetical protein